MEENMQNHEAVPLVLGKLPDLPELKALPGPKKSKRKLVLLVVLIVLLLVAGITSAFAYFHFKASEQASVSNSVSSQQAVVSDPYAGWGTYTDTGYPLASGISIKYPSDWKLTVGGKNVAWSIANTKADISVIDIFQDGTQTARQVWESCYATDACLGSSGIKIVSGEETTINGLNVYKATMHSDNSSVYHVTVIRGNIPVSDGIPYVMFTTYATDETTLKLFDTIMASTSFSSTEPQTSYLDIKEWGIKIRMDDADKVTYTIGGTPNGSSPNADGIVSWATLKLSSSLTTNSKCQALGYEVEQLTAGTNAAKIGQYSYGFSGVYDTCRDSSLDALRSKIVNSELKTDAIQAE